MGPLLTLVSGANAFELRESQCNGDVSLCWLILNLESPESVMFVILASPSQFWHSSFGTHIWDRTGVQAGDTWGT